MKQFDEWNEAKKQLNKNTKRVYFKQRDIFWASVGVNIGFEQDGKGEKFVRPVVVVKKYSNDIFLGVPLSTTQREGSFYYQFDFKDKTSTALLVQHKLYSSKRLIKKMGMINKDDFFKLKESLKELMFASKKEAIPKEIVKTLYHKNIKQKRKKRCKKT